MNDIVTRFAPSPTGYLHIGGARTALFNWLYAKHVGGKFKLRIEDTDKERSDQDATTAILDSLSWLGLNWDGDIVYQSTRADRHKEVVMQLLATGDAYYCYATPAELNEMRSAQEAAKLPTRYDGRWRNRSIHEAPAGVNPVIRIKSNVDNETVINDKVQGNIVFPKNTVDDFILVRSDGTPTYMLAVVVDDHDMGVTHIIRGDDHLTNAARQLQIYRALNWDVPIMAHIPLIYGPDGKKLSKRHGAIGVGVYRELGYIPSALRNYLVKLGWSNNDNEYFSDNELISAFDLPAIGKSPSRFDFKKLENTNGHYIREMSNNDLLSLWLDTLKFLPGGIDLLSNMNSHVYNKINRALSDVKVRVKTLNELTDNLKFLFNIRPLTMNSDAQKVLNNSGRDHLAAILSSLQKIVWTNTNIEEIVHTYADNTNIKFGVISQALRAAITGQTVSMPIFNALDILGREESLNRIVDQIYS